MIALGAVLSILVTAAALIFSNIQYRYYGKQTQMEATDHWLGLMDSSLNAPITENTYINTILDTKNYILTQYEQYPNDPSPDLSEKNERYFYMDYFKRLYPIEGMGSYHMTSEEIDFRERYETLATLFTDAKSSARGTSVYIAFLTENKTLFYLCDTYSYRSFYSEEVLYPGSRTYNFDAAFTLNGKYYDVNYNGKTNRVLPIIYNNETVAYVFVEYNFDSVMSDADSLTRTEIIVLSIASLLMIIAYSIGAHFLIIRNMSKLTKLATDFTNDLSSDNELEVKNPNIKSKDEIHDLSNSFVALESGIIKYIDDLQRETKEKEKINAELEVASRIQLETLPPFSFDDQHVSLHSFIKPAKEIGGDFYDYFYLGESSFAVVIADVSGKGVPAALFMMRSKAVLKAEILSHENLEEAVYKANNSLVNNNKESLFVTAFIGVIDFDKKEMTFVNCGHEKPYILSNGEIKKLNGTSNFVIGEISDFEYEQEKITFNEDDILFVFTDGLNESINENNEEFGYQRISDNLLKNKDKELNEIIKSMYEGLENFTNQKEAFDDVTMLALKIKGSSLHLKYEEKNYDIITKATDEFIDKFAYLPTKIKSEVGIIIDELANNLISYEEREDLVVEFVFESKEDELILKVISNGHDYNPFENHNNKYYSDESDIAGVGGFGIKIVKDLVKSYSYEYKDNHSIVTLVKNLK